MEKFEKRFKCAFIQYPWGVTEITASDNEKDIRYGTFVNVIIIIDAGVIYVYNVVQDDNGDETKTLVASSNNFTFKLSC